MRINIEDAEQVAEYRKRMRHDFDYVFFNSRALTAKRLGVDKWLFDNIRVEGLENVEAVKDKQLFYVSSHKSLADFLVQQYVFWENNLPIPRIIAGANLFKFPFKNFWKKCGAISLDRQIKKKLYLAALHEELKDTLLAGDNLLDYLMGTRDRGNGIGKPQTGVIGVVLDVAKRGKDIFAVPSDIYYDNIIEKDALKIVDMWKAKRDFHLEKGENLKAKIYDYLCFYSDYMAYIPRVFSKNKGNVYLKFGKAFPIKDFNKVSLVEKLQQDINDLGNGKL
ncbi:MAG: 1-acyl-sn-glycerol-3-phosphate acyltransferase [Candidatus Nanoarchaeia archaeon]|nr:1-acyl-sn-glycerol-3-phosphate acyltransferase [Candidatus Nanoarchaeia archaeon]MDD5741404.1 1-acyl-sn-glycerol-3-phosphate acyltransferase [Candidatus Nanoarchaeia archaeon]